MKNIFNRHRSKLQCCEATTTVIVSPPAGRQVQRFAFSFLLLAFSFTGCKKLSESPLPSDKVGGSELYSVDATAVGAFNALYTTMTNNLQPFQGTKSISLFAGLSADELALYSGVTNSTYLGYYKNALAGLNASSTTYGGTGSDLWSPLYSDIFRCNAAIEGLNSSDANSLTPAVRQQLIGEGKFMRAFFYFYLVNLFGDLPLCLSTDPQVNTLLARSPTTAVYKQIIADLQDAESLLSDNFKDNTLLNTTTERVRPTKWAAAALLARVYLYTGKYAQAEAEATNILNNTTLFANPLPALDQVFTKNSGEAIWQLQPTTKYFNTQEAQTMIIPSSGPNISSNMVFLARGWLSNFETGDQRAVLGNWINKTIYNVSSTVKDTVYYPFKYKKNQLDSSIISTTGSPGYTKMTEYFMVLRTGEQYLIRAEARAQQDNYNGALSDLNAIRNRAGLGTLNITDKTALLAAILHERQVELFTELGQRWLDLKRTGNIDNTMNTVTPLKANGNTWQSYQQLYPLPYASDLQLAPNLVQNNGY